MTELATDYMEGALPFSRRLGVRVHLAYCSMCRRYFRQLRATIALLHRLPQTPVPAQVEDKIVADSGAPDLPGERPAPS